MKWHEIEARERAFPVAQLTALIANMFRDEKKNPDGYTVEDFMPGAKPRKRQQTEEDQLAIVRLLNAAFGGKVVEN